VGHDDGVAKGLGQFGDGEAVVKSLVDIVGCEAILAFAFIGKLAPAVGQSDVPNIFVVTINVAKIFEAQVGPEVDVNDSGGQS
jgi:hypothetical protein